MQAILTSATSVVKSCTGGEKSLRSTRSVLPGIACRKSTLRVQAQPDGSQESGKTTLINPEIVRGNGSSNGSSINQLPTGDELEKVLKEMSPEQQQQLARLYMFLTQHPEARVDVKSLGNVRQAVNKYKTLIWRPAELLNGRMAMIGFTAALANEALTGAGLWQQLYFAPYAYFSAYFLVVVAAQLNKAFGRPQQGVGPFTQYAELVNGRAAMLGYVILAYVEYNQELRNAATIMYSRMQQGGPIGL